MPLGIDTWLMTRKFSLHENFPIKNVKDPDKKFWKTATVEVGFIKSEEKNSVVDGLSLITKHPEINFLESESLGLGAQATSISDAKALIQGNRFKHWLVLGN